MIKRVLAALVFFLAAAPVPALAHHILGRPAYARSVDGSTPPAVQIEAMIGRYSITFMVYPAFPEPKNPGRLHLYARRLDNGEPFTGNVTFSVRDDSWFSSTSEVLGVQSVDDGVYRQGYVFANAGNYIATATFEAFGEPYVVDFPLRVGSPTPVVPVVVAVGLVALVMGGVSATRRRRRAAP